MIAEVGEYSDKVGRRFLAEDTVTHTNGILIPGMIDAHVHYPQCGVIAAYGTRLLDWLEQHTFPYEARFGDAEFARAEADFFLDELLSNGTTTALVFGTVHKQSAESFFEAARERNLRMICGKVLMDRNAPDYLRDSPHSGYIDSLDLIKKWHGVDRLQYAVTPRFAPTSSEDQLAAAGRLLHENPGVYLHTHLAENREECKWVAKLFPSRNSYLDVYDHYGLLGPRSVFAHAIHLENSDWMRLAETNSSVAHCPTSNLFIGSGLFPMKTALSNQVKVGLGTDVGGGDSFSILRTINEAYKIQQLRESNMSPETAFYMATLGGARALDIADRIGHFAPGLEADFIVIDPQSTPLLARRFEQCKSVSEKLFALMMLGDDRVVRDTYILGKRVSPRTRSPDLS